MYVRVRVCMYIARYKVVSNSYLIRLVWHIGTELRTFDAEVALAVILERYP
jgi:hypothetical protein